MVSAKNILVIFLLLSSNCFSQSQDLKQLELDIQKLAQLKSMLSEMYRGYTILDKGYSSIKDLSQGNYSLHKTYLDKLLDVSSTVKTDPKIASVMEGQKQIDATCQSSRQLISQATAFTCTEKAAILTLLQNIAARSNSLIEELQMITTPGVLRMNDAERMEAIARIEKAMKEKLMMVQKQQKNMEALNTLRNKQHSETEKLKSLY
jgi:hypothetical protein